MNTEDDDALDLTEDMQADDQGGDDDDVGSIAPEAAAEEFSIEIEGEEAAAEETPLIREMRQQLSDAKRELAEHRKANTPKIEVGEKPTIEDCEYDQDKFEAEYDAWVDRKRQAETQDQTAAEQAEVRNREFQRQVTTYRSKLAALPMPEAQKEAAEKTVIAALPELLQSALVLYADDPAKVVVALAKYPAKLAEIARETDPIKAVIAMRELERKLVTRKAPPPPESDTVLRGSASIAGGSDQHLAKLEKEASRTGDRSKLIAYKSQRQAA